MNGPARNDPSFCTSATRRAPEPGRCLPALRADQLMVSVVLLDRMVWTAWLAQQSRSAGHDHRREGQAEPLAGLALVAGILVAFRAESMTGSVPGSDKLVS